MVDELITIDGMPLTGLTRDGEWKRLDEIEGWFSSPDVKRDKVPRPRGPGSFPSKVEYDNRLITYHGRVISRNHGYLHQAASQLAALGHAGPVKFLVDGHGPTQWAMVDLRGRIEPTFPTDTRLEFQIPLEAIDPFKYGDAYTVAGSSSTPAALMHRGTVDAWPVITVTGTSASGYTLSLNGRNVVVTRALVSGSPHTIDFKTGILRVGGSVARSGLSTANFSPIKPGQPQNMTISAGLFTAKYVDTFI